MGNAESTPATLSGSDIMFECPKCGKGLVIDCRGAGLNIRCPQCDNEMEVPIPEGLDLTELDKRITAEETLEENVKAVRMAPGDEASGAESAQIKQLQNELEAVKAQRQYISQRHEEMLKALKTVHRQIIDFRQALEDINRMIEDLAGKEADETQKII